MPGHHSPAVVKDNGHVFRALERGRVSFSHCPRCDFLNDHEFMDEPDSAHVACWSCGHEYERPGSGAGDSAGAA